MASEDLQIEAEREEFQHWMRGFRDFVTVTLDKLEAFNEERVLINRVLQYEDVCLTLGEMMAPRPPEVQAARAAMWEAIRNVAVVCRMANDRTSPVEGGSDYLKEFLRERGWKEHPSKRPDEVAIFRRGGEEVLVPLDPTLGDYHHALSMAWRKARNRTDAVDRAIMALRDLRGCQICGAVLNFSSVTGCYVCGREGAPSTPHEPVIAMTEELQDRLEKRLYTIQKDNTVLAEEWTLVFNELSALTPVVAAARQIAKGETADTSELRQAFEGYDAAKNYLACQSPAVRLRDLETERDALRERTARLQAEIADARNTGDVRSAQLLAVGCVLECDDKGEGREHSRWTQTLERARQVMRERSLSFQEADNARREVAEAHRRLETCGQARRSLETDLVALQDLVRRAAQRGQTQLEALAQEREFERQGIDGLRAVAPDMVEAMETLRRLTAEEKGCPHSKLLTPEFCMKCLREKVALFEHRETPDAAWKRAIEWIAVHQLNKTQPNDFSYVPPETA